MSLVIKTVSNSTLPLTTDTTSYEVRRETDTEVIYQKPDVTRSSNLLETIAFRKKTLAKDLNKHHSETIVITRPLLKDVDGVPTLIGYDNVTININSTAASTPVSRAATSQIISEIFAVTASTGVVKSDDINDFVNARRL